MPRVYLIILYCSFPLLIWCQEERRFSMGVMAGLTLAQIDGDNLQGYDKTGFVLGLRSGARITEQFEISTELLFNQRGSQTKAFNKSVIKKRRLETDFAEINFQLNYKEWYSPYTEMYKLQIYGGVSFGRLLRTQSFDNVEKELNLANLAPEFNSRDFGLMLGGSYYFDRHLALGFRFARSLNLLFDANESIWIEYNPKSLQSYYISIYTFYML